MEYWKMKFQTPISKPTLIIVYGTITNNKESRGLLAVQESIDHGVLE
jgi:hypothetical protein